MDKCPCGWELADYATHDLEGYKPLSKAGGLTEEQKHQISEHCKQCNQCTKDAEMLRDTFNRMPQMGKPLRECSLLDIGRRLRQAAMQPN